MNANSFRAAFGNLPLMNRARSGLGPSGECQAHGVSQSAVEQAARAICKSRKFESGQGTCSLLCMQFLGSPRDGPHACPLALRIHGDFARIILEAAR